jgi:pSer/pThr/pTyr-binding forkhead associated (FHA) protein/signal transduction histidine kinase
LEFAVPVTYWLSMIAGRNAGQRFMVSKNQGTIGRGPSNSIQVLDTEVSRVHLRYNVVGKRLEVSDLESSNGTHVNGNPIQRHKLSAGDVVKIGSTVFEFQIGDPPSGEELSERVSDTDYTIHDEIHTYDSPSSLSYFPAKPNLFVEGSHDNDSDPTRMVQIVSDMSFMYHASLVTSSESDRDKMLDSLVNLIFDWVAADRCCILLRQENDLELKVQAVRSRGQKDNQDKLLISQTIVNYVRENRVGILTSNAMDDQRLSGDGSIKEMGIQEAICVPIRGRNQLSGLIYIDALSPTGRSERDRFNKDHLKLMIAIGLQVGFAIDHERDLSRLLEQQQLATIGQTTSSLSHHMKNVLQGVNGGAHLVETGLKNRDMDLVEKGWEIVNRNQQEISKLVNDMLIFGQPYNPRRVNADLSAVIADVFEEIGPFLSRRNIKFDWSCETDEFLFRFDARGIHWALYNLINSCASTCHGITNGTIKVSVERGDDNAVVISIGDNGFVAKVSNPDDLFSPARLNPDHKMNPVELAVSRKLIQGHDGELTISHPESGGNLFTIKLPLEPAASTKAQFSPQG